MLTESETESLETTIQPLLIPREQLAEDARIPVEIVGDDGTVIARFAGDILNEYAKAKIAGREKVVFILPVGPVGQFEMVAARCNSEGIDLSDLVIINMDEYLTGDGKDFVPLDDPLSFRRHMNERFYALLDPKLAPPEDQRLFPDPGDLSAVPNAIEKYGGVDVCFGGIGITGHVAFNDPPEPGTDIPAREFADLPTRVVELSRETRLINSITTSRGNIDRIPRFAVTVGMREILGSRKVRIYMNRNWQSAIVRKILHGPVTSSVPASLLQEHEDTRFVIADYVAELPQPQLR
ncbi:MAG: glucosamine-6-phosphate isomerase [Rhodospirillales bacterium]|nr:glucosamine-6-phosphate isomerase [Rhodospirillales bacterium]